MIRNSDKRWLHIAHHLLPSEYPVTKKKGGLSLRDLRFTSISVTAILYCDFL
jgi:hypothetical protein